MPSTRALDSAIWRRDWRAKAGPSSVSTTTRNESQNRDLRRHWGRKDDQDGEKRELAESTRVYVGNMPYMAQARDVEELFTAAGFNVINIDISLDHFTNRNPSYCFVDLESAEAATTAMETLPGKLLLGRPLKVRPCLQKREKGNKACTALTTEHWRSTRATSPAFEGTTPRNIPLLLPQNEQRRLIITGLPKPRNRYDSDLEIRALFKGLTVEAVSKVKSPMPPYLGNAWYAFVDFGSAEEARIAIEEVDGVEMRGVRVGVRKARRVPEKMFERDIWESEEGVLRALRGPSSAEDAPLI